MNDCVDNDAYVYPISKRTRFMDHSVALGLDLPIHQNA